MKNVANIRFKKSKIPESNWENRIAKDKAVHRFVRRIWMEINEQRTSQVLVCERSGVCISAIRRWRLGSRPYLHDIEAVLNVLGFELIIRRKDE